MLWLRQGILRNSKSSNKLSTNKLFVLYFLMIFFISQRIIAKEGILHGIGEFGFTNTSGNTETQNVYAKLGMNYQYNLWKHDLRLNALRADEENEITAERYETIANTHYHLSKLKYLFGIFQYENDRFNGYDYQTSIGSGYGRKVLDKKRIKLELKAGLGIKKYEFEPTNQLGLYGILILGLNYSQKIGTHSELIEEILVETGSDNTFIRSDTGFMTHIIHNLALKVSLSIRYNSDIPNIVNSGDEDNDGVYDEIFTEKIKHTDTITAITLVYNF